MTFLIIHNKYSKAGGEESVVAFQSSLLQQQGHQVILYERDYKESEKWFLGKIRTIFTSIYNSRSIKDLNRILSFQKVDIALIHNVYSIISPAVIPFLHDKGVKVWQIVHNYRLFCPTGIFFHDGKICEDCMKKDSYRYCAKNNCFDNRLKSIAFAFKFSVIKKRRYYDKADRFYCLSHFQQNKLQQGGINKDKLYYLPNTFVCGDNQYDNSEDKTFIGFVGRLTEEKGFYTFIELAEKMPEKIFIVAGEVTNEIKKRNIPKNLQFEGFLDKQGMRMFYKKCRVILFLSRWYEGFPMVLLESMFFGVPVIANNLSVMAEVIKDGENGFLINNYNDTEYIKDKIDTVFKETQLYGNMRKNCIDRFNREYSVDLYYKRLIYS